MKDYGKDVLENMYKVLTCTFNVNVPLSQVVTNSGKTVVTKPPASNDNKLTFLACFRNNTVIEESAWLGVDVLVPGYTKNAGCYSPTLLRPSVSFYYKRGTPDKVLDLAATELPINFFAANQAWFQAHQFVDVAFGYKEHGYVRILAKGAPQAYFRPTRFWNIAEAGHVTDLIVEFVRMWCKV